MKPPPDPPPNAPPKDAKPKDDWADDVLSDRPAHGMSHDAAHRVLEMNPALRAQGADTGFLVNQSAQARHSGKQGLSTEAPKTKENAFAQAKDVDHLIGLANKRFDEEKIELETQLSLLQAKVAGLKDRHLSELMDRMAELDPNLSSVITQEAMKTHKKLLDVLGFSPTKFVERLRAKRK